VLSGGRGHLRIGALVKVVAESPNANTAIVTAGKDVAVVCGNGIDGRVVCFHFSHQMASFHRPELNVPSSTA